MKKTSFISSMNHATRLSKWKCIGDRKHTRRIPCNGNRIPNSSTVIIITVISRFCMCVCVCVAEHYLL